MFPYDLSSYKLPSYGRKVKPIRRMTKKVPRYQLIGEKSMKFMKEANARLTEKESKEKKKQFRKKHSNTSKRSINGNQNDFNYANAVCF